MPITTYRLAEVYKLNKDMFVLDLLVESISPRERQIYYFVAETKKTNAMDIAKKFKMSTNSVDNMLSRLRRYGLLEREVATGKSGLYFEWRIAK